MLKLKKINPQKSTGCDNIPGKLLRLAHNELSIPLSNVFNSCIKQCVFPDIMKCGEVSPVYKKNDNIEKINYRPASVLTSLSKIFESVFDYQ